MLNQKMQGVFPKKSAYDIYKEGIKSKSMLSYNPELKKQELQDKIKRLDDQEEKEEEDEARVLREYNQQLRNEEKIALGIPLVPSFSKNRLKIYSGPTVSEIMKRNSKHEKQMINEAQTFGGYSSVKKRSYKKRSYKKRSVKYRRRNIAKQRHARSRRHK